SDDWGDSNVHACDYNCDDGKMNWTDWEDYEIDNEWEGMESCPSGNTVGMLLNLDEGTLTVYKNNRRLGVIKDGLSGSYCWYIEVPNRLGESSPFESPWPGDHGTGLGRAREGPQSAHSSKIRHWPPSDMQRVPLIGKTRPAGPRWCRAGQTDERSSEFDTYKGGDGKLSTRRASDRASASEALREVLGASHFLDTTDAEQATIVIGTGDLLCPPAHHACFSGFVKVSEEQSDHRHWLVVEATDLPGATHLVGAFGWWLCNLKGKSLMMTSEDGDNVSCGGGSRAQVRDRETQVGKRAASSTGSERPRGAACCRYHRG
ncbi:hypothetical protein THAOC_29344, partial [Thalassiosira oceanica]